MTNTATPKCPSCGFSVFNRRYPKCERCGVQLPESLVYSSEQLAALRSREQNEATGRTGAADANPGNIGDDNSWLYVISANGASGDDCSGASGMATDAGSCGG